MVVAETHPQGKAKVRDLALVVPMQSVLIGGVRAEPKDNTPGMHGLTAIQTQREDGQVPGQTQDEVRRVEHCFLLTWVDSQG